MRMSLRVAERGSLVGIMALALIAVRPGAAYQRNSQMPAPKPDYSSSTSNNNIIPGRTSSMDDSPVAREWDEKRSRAMNSERQRMMVKEANQMVQTAAELQVAVTQGVDGAMREEEAKRAEAIEKLARNVKDRMKGSR